MTYDSLNIKISRRILRTLVIINFYDCHVFEKQKGTLLNGFDLYIKDVVFNFITIFSYIKNSLLNKNITFDLPISNQHFEKCLQKYGINNKYDTVTTNNIEAYIKEIIPSNEISEEEFKSLFEKIINNNDLMKFFNPNEDIYIYKDLFLQFINKCFSEHFWEGLCSIDKCFDKERSFYMTIVEDLYNNFEKITLDFAKYITNWRIERVDIIEKIIICTAIIENKKFQTPRSPLLNEYIDLAKLFCGDDAGKFVNGILDIDEVLSLKY